MLIYDYLYLLLFLPVLRLGLDTHDSLYSKLEASRLKGLAQHRLTGGPRPNGAAGSLEPPALVRINAPNPLLMELHPLLERLLMTLYRSRLLFKRSQACIYITVHIFTVSWLVYASHCCACWLSASPPLILCRTRWRPSRSLSCFWWVFLYFWVCWYLFWKLVV